jgi:uncharacterized protein (DUF111 family)
MLVVETNVDDMSPALWEHVFERLFAAAARDVWLSPVSMKKGRPAAVLSVLCEPPARAAVCETLLRETTSIGVRWYAVDREVLERRVVDVETPYGRIPVKLSGRGSEVWNVAPEHEACLGAARARGVPLKEVYASALAAARALQR